MTTPTEICDAIGRKRLAALLGKKHTTAISNAVTAGKLPPRWFDVIEKECQAIGVECPRAAFSFDRVHSEAPSSAGEAV